MKIKIKIRSLLLASIAMLMGLGGISHALEPVADKARLVHTEKIIPLGVTIEEGPSDETLFVEVFSPKLLTDTHQARFSWYDQNRVPVGSYVSGMEAGEFLGLRKIRIPRLEFVGNYGLQVDIFSVNGWLLATGETNVEIASGSERLQLSAPVLIREADGFRFSYDLKNYNLRQSVVPRLQVYYFKNGERQYVLQRKLPALSMGPRATGEVEFLVREELPNGEYYLETWVESQSGKYLSGVVESYMQLPGSYARLADLEVNFPSETAQQANVLVEGFALVPRDSDLKVRLTGDYKGLKAQALMSVPVIDGYFVEKAFLEFTEAVPFFSGQIDIFVSNGLDLGDALLTQTFSSPIILDPVPEIETPTKDTTKTPVVSTEVSASTTSWWQNQWLIMIGAGLLALLVGMALWKLLHRKRARVF